jgi:PAS domain S-box-containing protein
MIRIVYIGKENKRRIDVLRQIDDIILDIIDTKCDTILEKLPKDVIDLFVMNNENTCMKENCFLKTEKRLQHIPTISLINPTNGTYCNSDLLVSESVSDIEFIRQVKTLIKMKLTDDELKKEKILLELKVKDRTNELENKAERLRITFNSIGEGVMVTNEIGNVISVNPIAMKMCNMERNDFVNKKLDEVFNVYKNDIKINIFSELSEIKNPFLSLEDVILKVDDEKSLIVNYSASPMVNNEGNLMGIVLVFRDNTEDYEIKRKLIESESRFRTLFENMTEGVAIHEMIYDENENPINYRILTVNPSYQKQTGINTKDVIGKFGDEVYGTTPAPYLREFNSVILNNKSYSFETYFEQMNKYFSISLFSPRPKQFVTVFQDITSKKLQDMELEKNISLLKSTLESTADGILVVDYNGKILSHNKKFMDMWNLPESILENSEDENLLRYAINQLKYPEEFMNKVKHLYSDPEATSFDILEFSDGRFFERYSIPQKINNKTIGRVWSFRDVTQKKLSEKELILAKEKAEESNKLKTEFLLSMTHEIRTPMNSILGFSSQLNKDTPPNKLLDYVNIIKNSGELLITIIDDIIDLSKLQSGGFKIEKDQFDINNMLVKSEEEYNQHIKTRGKNIELVLDLGKFPLKTYSDGNRVKQVLNNLVINAIKFTDSGTITYGYTKKDKDIVFFVKDTGRGISKENTQKIFEKFYRVQDVGQKKQEGTGLGLTISKSIVELLGGKIWVESEIGVGSSFYFTVPMEENPNKSKEKTKPTKKKYDWENKNVLIVEDNDTNFQLLELILTQTKIKIFRAKNGEEFHQIFTERKYNIVLLDYVLPDISGCEILEYIKKHTDTPVVITSSYNNKTDIDKAQELGVDVYLVKPIIWNVLSEEMNKLLNS